MADRAHLSIGEVLSLLQDDFPDITISKIRFLESQGLLDPERTPSGYRKFYEGDIERLRWILRQQKDNFLPLRVIKDRLEEIGPSGAPTEDIRPAAEPRGASESRPGGEPRHAAEPHAGEPHAGEPRPGEPRHAAAPRAAEPHAAETHAPAPTAASLPPKPSIFEQLQPEAAKASSAEPAARAPRVALDTGPSAVSLTTDELAAASGCSDKALGDLVRYGLIAGRPMGRDTVFDEEALVVARLAASFGRFGVEARHLRMYKVAAEREAGFLEQVVLPLLKQRNPSARRQAIENLNELTNLGDSLRGALLRQTLRGYTR